MGRVVVTTTDCPDVPSTEKGGLWSWLLMISAVLVLVAHGFGLYAIAPAFGGPLWLTSWGPPVVTVALLGSVLAAWSWRRNDAKGPLVLLVLFVAFMVATYWVPLAWIGAVVVGGVLAWRARPRAGDEWQAWRGAGPGVLLGLSLIVVGDDGDRAGADVPGLGRHGSARRRRSTRGSARRSPSRLVPLVLLVIAQAVVLLPRLTRPAVLDERGRGAGRAGRGTWSR